MDLAHSFWEIRSNWLEFSNLLQRITNDPPCLQIQWTPLCSCLKHSLFKHSHLQVLRVLHSPDCLHPQLVNHSQSFLLYHLPLLGLSLLKSPHIEGHSSLKIVCLSKKSHPGIYFELSLICQVYSFSFNLFCELQIVIFSTSSYSSLLKFKLNMTQHPDFTIKAGSLHSLSCPSK